VRAEGVDHNGRATVSVGTVEKVEQSDLGSGPDQPEPLIAVTVDTKPAGASGPSSSETVLLPKTGHVEKLTQQDLDQHRAWWNRNTTPPRPTATIARDLNNPKLPDALSAGEAANVTTATRKLGTALTSGTNADVAAARRDALTAMNSVVAAHNHGPTERAVERAVGMTGTVRLLVNEAESAHQSGQRNRPATPPARTPAPTDARVIDLNAGGNNAREVGTPPPARQAPAAAPKPAAPAPAPAAAPAPTPTASGRGERLELGDAKPGDRITFTMPAAELPPGKDMGAKRPTGDEQVTVRAVLADRPDVDMLGESQFTAKPGLEWRTEDGRVGAITPDGRPLSMRLDAGTEVFRSSNTADDAKPKPAGRQDDGQQGGLFVAPDAYGTEDMFAGQDDQGHALDSQPAPAAQPRTPSAPAQGPNDPAPTADAPQAPEQPAPGQAPQDALDVVHGAANAAQGHPEPDPEPEPNIIYVENDRVVNFPAHKLADAIARIDVANQKAERAGIPDKISYKVSRYTKKIPADHPDGIPTYEPYVKLELDVPSLKHDGWEFVATLAWNRDSGDLIVRSATGQKLTNRPEARRCDVCKTSRDRKDTYVVRNEAGEERQVGKSCLKQFFGITPEGLWLLGWEPNFDDPDGLNAPKGSGEEQGSGGNGNYRTVDILALTLAIVEDKGWLSKENAAPGTTSTSALVHAALSPGNSEKDQANTWARRSHELKEEAVALRDFIGTLEPDPNRDSEYVLNLRSAAAGDYIDWRNVPLLASGIAAKIRRDEDQMRLAAVKDSQTIGEIGDKLVDLPGRVTVVRPIASRYGHSTLVTVVTGDGNVVKYFAPGEVKWRTDDFVTVSATITKHGDHQGITETTIGGRGVTITRADGPPAQQRPSSDFVQAQSPKQAAERAKRAERAAQVETQRETDRAAAVAARQVAGDYRSRYGPSTSESSPATARGNGGFTINRDVRSLNGQAYTVNSDGVAGTLGEVVRDGDGWRAKLDRLPQGLPGVFGTWQEAAQALRDRAAERPPQGATGPAFDPNTLPDDVPNAITWNRGAIGFPIILKLGDQQTAVALSAATNLEDTLPGRDDPDGIETALNRAQKYAIKDGAMRNGRNIDSAIRALRDELDPARRRELLRQVDNLFPRPAADD
ncbi:MAG: hypothetical protein JWL97_3512, partial [Gemmatimonadales bacterium]|nr:hypothetical protein [Gemmatimonadales bacterium]